MVKFIHTGDLHLGLKFQNVSFHRDKAIERRRELWTTFERIVKYAIDENVDFLFIAGDLFEEAYFTIGDITRVRDNFRNAKSINIVISAGNHDYKGRKSLYNRIEWTENVTIFNGNGIQRKEFPELNTSIYGYSWDSMEINQHELFQGLNESIDKGHNNILVLHGDVGSKSNYLPLNINELKVLNMDYIALGHIHKPEILGRNIAYCGSPEPLDFGEVGERGIIKGAIKEKKLEFKLIPFSKRTFYEVELTLNEEMGYPDIIEKIQKTSIGNKKMDFYRINLTGFIERNISMGNVEKDLDDEFYHLEIKDNTILDYDLESLEKNNRDNIIGVFIKSMKEKDLNNPLVKDALYLGLEALLKGRI